MHNEIRVENYYVEIPLNIGYKSIEGIRMSDSILEISIDVTIISGRGTDLSVSFSTA